MKDHKLDPRVERAARILFLALGLCGLLGESQVNAQVARLAFQPLPVGCLDLPPEVRAMGVQGVPTTLDGCEAALVYEIGATRVTQYDLVMADPALSRAFPALFEWRHGKCGETAGSWASETCNSMLIVTAGPHLTREEAIALYEGLSGYLSQNCRGPDFADCIEKATATASARLERLGYEAARL